MKALVWVVGTPFLQKGARFRLEPRPFGMCNVRHELDGVEDQSGACNAMVQLTEIVMADILAAAFVRTKMTFQKDRKLGNDCTSYEPPFH